MGGLEERIVEALVALCDDEPGCERHMFVFPVGLMNPLGYLQQAHRIVRAGDVLMVRREDSAGEPDGIRLEAARTGAA